MDQIRAENEDDNDDDDDDDDDDDGSVCVCLCLCACVHACVHVCVHVSACPHVYTCMWRSEVNLKCLHILLSSYTIGSDSLSEDEVR